MAKKEQYCIEVRPYNRPETIVRGVLEKNTGQTQLAGDTINVLNKRADVGLPNHTEFWGVRLDADGKVPKDNQGNVLRLDVKDPKYKGQIKELVWNDPEGCLINGRYLKGFNTIDQQYQDVVLNATANLKEDHEASADAHFLRLQSGDNYYDPEANPYLCQMFRVHYMNENSKFRSPDSQSSMFRERDETKVVVAETRKLSSKFEALKIVNEASIDPSLSELKNLYSIMGEIVSETVKDDDLYRYLSMLADTMPDRFMTEMLKRKQAVSSMIEMGKSFKVFDLTRDGVIAAGAPSVLAKEPLLDKVPAKGDKMLDWMYENNLKAGVFEAISKLKKITDNLK